MNWRVGMWSGAIAVSALVPLSNTFADDKKESAEREEKIEVVTPDDLGKFWIGIQATPILDEVLLGHLNLEKGLIVNQVVPDSPAAKAGVQERDVLVKFGDKKLDDLKNLIDAVNEVGNQEAALVVIRKGKEQTIQVTPADRPKDDDVVIRRKDALEVPGIPGAGRNPIIMRYMGPGVAEHRAVLAGPQFPDGLSLTVTKSGGEPAKIVAKKDGKTYETTEQRLDVLPEEVRIHVQRLLSGPQAIAITGGGPWIKQPEVDDRVRQMIITARSNAGNLVELNEKQAEALKAHVEKLHDRLQENKDEELQTLKHQFDALRKDVEELKAKLK